MENKKTYVKQLVKHFKSVGIKISEFSKRENIPSRILYELSAPQKNNNRILDEIINALEHDYPKEYEQLKRIIEVTENVWNI